MKHLLYTALVYAIAGLFILACVAILVAIIVLALRAIGL